MSRLNVHFKQCEGTTYTQALDRMLEDGAVSARGLKPDAKVFGELVFDVNTAYFEEHGGYEYAKQFFREAFHFAEKEIGADYILSAVMHADERNRSLSEESGREVYHYHMHVIYIPVVEKEIKWSKRCKDKSLVGTTREVIHQISHSKKWAFVLAFDERGQPALNKDGKPKLIPSYSLLQDRFYEHMKAAGYTDFERGERGSTAEHLTILDYKIQQDKERLEQIETMTAAQSKELSDISNQLDVQRQVNKTYMELDDMGRKKMSGKFELSEQDYREVMRLAKEALSSRGTINSLERQLQEVTTRLWGLRDSFDKLADDTREFRDAIRLAPRQVKQLFSDIFRQAKEARELKQMQSQRSGKNVR